MTKHIAVLLALACGAVAGCGDNTSEPFTPWELEELTAAQGLSLRIPQFSIEPGRESQNCYFVKVPDLDNGNDVFIHRVVTAINPGSHHVNVFRVKTIAGLDPAAGTPIKLGPYDATEIEGSDDFDHNPCWNSANWADWPLVANSQHSNVGDLKTDWVLPDQVGLRLHPGEQLMIQTHFVNTTDQPAEYGGRVGINFYRYDDPRPPIEMGTLFATQQNIRICKSTPQPTFSGTCRFPNAVTIAAANGHFHKRGVNFAISSWDGTSTAHPAPAAQFYDSSSWDDPIMETDLAVPQPANTGIWWDCAYGWHPPDVVTCDDVNAKDPLHEGDCCYTFGGNTDIGEHCNVFLYYYPKVDTDVFCN